MNCRKVNSLLSAYIDSELSGVDQLQIRDHLGHCMECSREHEALLETKRLVARLRVRAPRADLLDHVLQTVHQGDAADTLLPSAGFGGRQLAMSRGAMAGVALGMCAAAAVVMMVGRETAQPDHPIQWSNVSMRDVHPLEPIQSSVDLGVYGSVNPLFGPSPGQKQAFQSGWGAPAIQSVSAYSRPQMFYGLPDQRLVPFQPNR